MVILSKIMLTLIVLFLVVYVLDMYFDSVKKREALSQIEQKIHYWLQVAGGLLILVIVVLFVINTLVFIWK
ncbi:hypothetical protein ACIQ1D_19025 [Lysinibacillus xylanilyticus]|uniref:hypothetical protein n=1 Tax=Lysinibacillus xylanilyticus TaxID=582475 RepID=UPI00380B238E